MAKRQSLFPIEYDEISLVDSGGGAAEDGSISPSVLIMKRDNSVNKLNPVSNNPGGSSKPSGSSSSGSSSSSSTKSTAPSPVVGSGGKKKKKKTDPCNPKSSTGAKTGKSSQRAKNWQDGKHPRQQGGKFGTTSAESKKKYGKGGTTKSKQVAECKRRHGAKVGEAAPKTREPHALKFTPQNALAAGAKGRKKKILVKSWNTDARLRALVERKAAR